MCRAATRCVTTVYTIIFQADTGVQTITGGTLNGSPVQLKSKVGEKVQFIASVGVPYNQPVVVVLNGVTNPTTGGSKTLTFSAKYTDTGYISATTSNPYNVIAPTATPTNTLTPTVTPTSTETLTPTQTNTGTVTTTPTPTPAGLCTTLSLANPCVPGGPASATGCYLEWALTPVPTRAGNSIPKNKLSCAEGDPACDFDPDTSNHSCTFHVRLCLNNADPRLTRCHPADLAKFEVRAPNPARLVGAADTANLATLENQAGAGGFGVTIMRGRTPQYIGVPDALANDCSPPLDIQVPLRVVAKRVLLGRKILRLRTTSSAGKVGFDWVTLECRPNPCLTGSCTPTATLPPTNTPTLGVPTNTPTVSPTGTATAPPSDTPTVTNTPTVTGTATVTDTATATASASPTGTPGSPILVVIAPGGGSSGSCRGTCSGGPDAGQPCGLNTDCGTVPAGTPTPSCGGTKACVGGPYNGMTCTSASQCNGCDPDRICTAAGTPLACCTGAAAGSCPAVGSCALVVGSVPVKLPLNGVCLPRSYPPGDVDCSTNIECYTCVGGANDGKTCGKTANDCPSGSCSGNGTCQLAGLSFVPGTENANNEIPLTIPQSSLILNPAVVSGIGAVCVAAGGDGTGLIDCVGGEVNLNATSIHDHNTTPKVCLTGTKTGSTCTKNSDCPSGTCNNTCVNGTKAGSNCTSSADCSGGGTCMGNSMHGPYTAAAPTPGMPDDPTCTSKVKQPDGSMSYACLEQDKQCSGGTNAGAVCTADTDCPGSSCALCNIGATQTCSGGTNAGKSCSTASDCPSGTCVITAKHPGVCNSPSQVVQSGTYAAGDMAIALPLGLTILSSPQANGAPPTDGSWGPDGLPCTGDEPGAASPPVTVLLSTGTNIVYVYDANNIAGTVVTAQVNGHGVSCPNLIGGTVTGMTLGGGFGAVDSTAGDIATIFQFVAQ